VATSGKTVLQSPVISSLSESGKPWLCTVCGRQAALGDYSYYQQQRESDSHYQQLHESQRPPHLFGGVKPSEEPLSTAQILIHTFLFGQEISVGERGNVDAPLIVNFLNHLETTRGNGAGSRNIRLAAIKSFMHYMEYRVPSALEQIQRILAIPAKRTDTHLVRHLTAQEMQSILDAPDPTVRDGIRDRAMLHLCFAGGLRVS
jgi:hypothetical protein